MRGRLIKIENVATSEKAARVDASRCLAKLWAQMVEVEAKVDILEV